MKSWNLLIDNEIIELIIGDKCVKKEILYELKMPYMTKKDILEFSQDLGFEQNDFSDKNKTRKEYIKDLLNYIIENGKINNFFDKLIQIKRFRNVEMPYGYDDVQILYWDIIHAFFYSINKILFFDNCHIEYDIDKKQYLLIDDNEEVEINIEKVKNVDRQYIKKIGEQIDIAVKSNDYESAITKSRTLIEEVLVLGIENKKEEATEKGNINTLFNQFKTLYNMHQDSNADKRINGLLSGIEKIITAISQMRDKNSDSHGVGKRRINLEEHHVILFTNSAKTIANFLLAVIEKNIDK